MEFDLLNNARIGIGVSPLFQMDSPTSLSPLLRQKSHENEATFDDIFDQLAANGGDLMKSPLHYFTPPDILQNVESLMSLPIEAPDNFESTDAKVVRIPTMVHKKKRDVPQLTMDLTGRKIKENSTSPNMAVRAPPMHPDRRQASRSLMMPPPPAVRRNPTIKKKKSPPNLKKRSKVLTQKSYEENPGPVEEWRTVDIDEDYEDYVDDVMVSVKTRCEAPVYCVPPTLYSSLKYEMKSEVVFTGDARDCEVLRDVPFLLGKVKVVHSENYREITRGKGGGNVLKGIVESALTRIDEDSEENCEDDKLRFIGTMKVQFNNVSYHHKKHDLRWEVHYFQPHDLENPVLVVRSGAFKVFARKPSTKKKSKRNPRKRKRDINCFTEKLNELVRCAKKLKVGEKKKAYKMISTRLVDLDPNFFSFLDN